MDRDRIEQLAEQGHRGANHTLRALKSLSFQLSGAQLGITITSLLVGFLIEPTLAPILRPGVEELGLPASSSLGVSIVVGLFLATAFEMVVAELVPKNVAIARPGPVAFAVTLPLRITNAAARPLIVFLNSVANWTVRRLGIEPREELMAVHSLEELEVLIRSSREGGALAEEEFSLLARSISFSDKTAADALVPRVSMAAVNRDATLQKLTETALETGHSRLPVWGSDLDDILGVAHVKDVYEFPVRRRATMKVTEILREPFVVPESRRLDALLADMRRGRHQMAIVVDEFGGTAGMITLEDILEEIVGEIEDEYDPRTVSPEVPPEGAYVLSGMLHADEVADSCGFRIPEGPYETLAGFLLHAFDRIPSPGDHIAHDGWELKVVAMEGRRIAKVLLVAPPHEPEPEQE